jgi:hypothetical protein
MQSVSLFVSTTGAINGSNVASGRNNWLGVASGGQLALPALQTFAMDANQQTIDWTADGAGSLLDLPKLDTIVVEGDARFGRFQVLANNGGRIGLSELDAISFTGDRPISFVAQGAGSSIDISTLPLLARGVIRPRGGEIRIADTLTLADQAAIQGDGTLIGGVEISGASIVPGEGPVRPETGTLTITGNLTIHDGTLVAHVLGLTNGQFDAVTVNGTATLGGTIELQGNFAAKIGDQVRIVQAGGILGHFSLVEGVPIANSQLGFAIHYSQQEVFARATLIGDVNFDNEFNSGDLLEIFAAGEYEDTIEDNSVWIEGDWNGDGEFESGDLVAALATGAYEAGPIGAALVPEPSGLRIVVLLLLGYYPGCRRRRD